ncbi:MAG: hypothetical protein EXR65_01915 [Dehalococcoidia bacterium]|nr:hypothetical protein [Dehalococcoidia bacterium]
MVCRDDPAVNPVPPTAPFDTLTLIGSGRWNGVDGYIITVTLVDAGEPGRLDSISLVVRGPGAGGPIVASSPARSRPGGTTRRTTRRHAGAARPAANGVGK